MKLRQCVSLGDPKDVIMKYVATVIPLVRFDICPLELEYVIWSDNKWDMELKDLRDNLHRW